MKNIKVTQKIINASNSLINEDGTVEACFSPVAIALNKQTDFHGWFTSYNDSNQKMTAHAFGSERKMVLPESVMKFENEWAEGKEVSPIEFDISDDVWSVI